MGKAAKRTARERLAEQRRIEAQRKKRNRTLGIAAGAVAIIAAIVVVVVVIQANRSTSGGFSGKLAPITKQANGTVVMAKPGVTAPVLDIWEDFQCPICHEFEKANDSSVKRLAAEGKAKVVYHPMTIFAAQQAPAAHDNSVRALNASMAAPAGKWMAFHDKLYENQPPETKQNGFPTSQLLQLGKDVGITDKAFQSAVTGMKYEKQAAANTERALKQEGIQGTPTLKLNGQEMNLEQLLSDKDALPDAVEKAGS